MSCPVRRRVGGSLIAARGDQAFLECAVARGFLRACDLDEIRADCAEIERFLGRPAPACQVAAQRQWLTPQQVAEIRAATGRHVLLCPACWSRINCFTMEAGRRFWCATCQVALRVPPDPEAQVLLRDESPAATRAVPAPANAQATRRLTPYEAGLVHRGFEILQEIGRGGQGIVYRARQQPLGRVVAIKVLHASLGQNPAFVRRFFREAKALGHVEHNHVVAIYDAGFVGGSHYLVLQWIEGRNLEEQVEKRGRLAPALALRLGLDAARGLAAVHAQGIVHRDVKPSNILVRADDSACITDFGLVRRTASETTAALTKTGDILGTIKYMAPEQLRDPRKATARSDIYSLGATLYHLLSGVIPFAEDAPPVAAARLLRGDVPRLEAEAPTLPADLVALVRRMMACDPKDRFATMEEAGLAMHVALRGVHRLSRPGHRPDEETKVPVDM